MISLPMSGRTNEDIIKRRDKAFEKIKKINSDYELINTFFDNSDIYFPEGTNIPLYCLSKALSQMSKCDTVYFCKGWEKSRGCRIEHEVAQQYNLNIIEE